MALPSLEELKKEKAKQSPKTNYALQTLYNVPESGAQFIQDTILPLLSPIETAKNLIELGTGIYHLSTPGEQPSEEVARAVGKYFYDRYGGENLEQVKTNVAKTLKEDPVGFFADLALPLSVVRAPLKADSVIVKVTKAIDPTEVLIKGTGAAYQHVAKPSFQAVGGMIRGQAGIGDGVLSTAYYAAREGGEPLAYLKEQMSKNADLETKLKPVYSYLEGLENIANARKASYLEKMSELGLENIKINPLNVRQTVIEATNEFTKEGLGTPKIKAKINEVNNLVDEFLSNPKLHTIDGLDFLKQSLDDLKPDALKKDRTGAYITTLQNKFKNQILEQSPEYRGVMEAYSESKTLQDQIQKAIGKQDPIAIESISRKLQASTRDNVATSYGLRSKLIDELAMEGKQPMLPYQLAGQALEPILPRGIGRVTTPTVTGLLGGAGVFVDPSFFALAAAQTGMSSPRFLAEVAMRSGQISGKVSPSLQKLSNVLPELRPTVAPTLRTTRLMEAAPISETKSQREKEEFLRKYGL
jgi:hypothetical protein